MEYLMWAKRKNDDSNSHISLAPPPVISSYGDSWEEQAFAEDAAGALGGCVWPPRSYSCSFCRREFRSAQALGGHMNVHRRDRARLKQNPNPQSEVVVAHNHALNPCSTLSFDAPTFLYKNPNSNEFYDPRLLGTNSNPRNVIRASSLEPIKVNSEEKSSTTLSFFSPVVEKNHMINIKVPIAPPPISWSSFVAEKRDFRALRQIENSHEKKSSTTSEKDCHVREDCVAVNLNLVVSQTPSSDEEVGSHKRRRIEANPLSLFTKLSAVDRCNLHQSEVFKSSTEELDLELRLGDAPKVK